MSQQGEALVLVAIRFIRASDIMITGCLIDGHLVSDAVCLKSNALLLGSSLARQSSVEDQSKQNAPGFVSI